MHKVFAFYGHGHVVTSCDATSARKWFDLHADAPDCFSAAHTDEHGHTVNVYAQHARRDEKVVRVMHRNLRATPSPSAGA